MQCNTIKLNINLETNMHRTKNLIWVFNIIILAAALPSEWEDMKGDLVKTFLLPVGSTEYNNVVTETMKTGLNANIISVRCFWKHSITYHRCTLQSYMFSCVYREELVLVTHILEGSLKFYSIMHLLAASNCDNDSLQIY